MQFCEGAEKKNITNFVLVRVKKCGVGFCTRVHPGKRPAPGAITISKAKHRLDAETLAASLATGLGVDQHSELSDGDSVGQSGSEGDSELPNSEDDFLAPGIGDQDATPMLSAEKSPPPTVMSARTRSHTDIGRTDYVRVLNMPPKSDESSGNDDDGGDASSDDVTGLSPTPLPS